MDEKAGNVDRNNKPTGWRKLRDAAKAAAWAKRKREKGEKDILAQGGQASGVPFDDDIEGM
jgi:hypothetical protein